MKSQRHICTACNHIWEACWETADCGCNLNFDALPEDWKCPECGGDKEMYQPCSCVSVQATKHKNESFVKKIIDGVFQPKCKAHQRAS